MNHGFKEFLPKGYSSLMVYDVFRKKRISIDVNLLISFSALDQELTIVSFFEGKSRRFLLTDHSLEEIGAMFMGGDND